MLSQAATQLLAEYGGSVQAVFDALAFGGMAESKKPAAIEIRDELLRAQANIIKRASFPHTDQVPINYHIILPPRSDTINEDYESD